MTFGSSVILTQINILSIASLNLPGYLILAVQKYRASFANINIASSPFAGPLVLAILDISHKYMLHTRLERKLQQAEYDAQL